MTNEDEFLERIVGGIHALTAKDADVRWNDRIGGRQFDVSVRFKMGPLRYLAVVEVKNRNRKAKAEDLDAFVTKARDQNANKLVFVTAAGFQSGALAVARRHGVEIFTVTFDTDAAAIPQELGVVTIPPKGPGPHAPMHMELSEPILSAVGDEVTVVYASGRRLCLPTEATQMTYYANRTRLEDGRTLFEVIEQPLFNLIEGEVRRCEQDFEPPLRLLPPDRYVLEAGPVTRLEWRLTGESKRWIQGNGLIDPAAFVAPVVYTNALTDEVIRFALHQLPLGLEPMEAGQFYCFQQPLQYIYCSGISGGWARLHIVESFQLGQLFRTTVCVTLPDTRHYVRVRDKQVLVRLKGRLEDFARDPDLNRGLTRPIPPPGFL